MAGPSFWKHERKDLSLWNTTEQLQSILQSKLFLHGQCQVFMVRKKYFRQVCWSLTHKPKNSSIEEQANNFSISLFLQRGQVLLLAAFLRWLAGSWFIQISFQKADQNWCSSFPHKTRKSVFSIKKYILCFCYKTENREIMEMSAMTKNKGKRMLRANKRHLWFEWVRSC